ncbi:YARHG domain-containing protein [Myroides marinus]|nr:YARHG domain-containing protein [Myroides marinus]
MTFKTVIRHNLIYIYTSSLLFISTISLSQNTPKYSEKVLNENSIEELALMRNEILAKKGYVFTNSKYSNYFERQKWYKPASSNNTITLDANENTLVDLIKKVETKKKEMRVKALNDLKELKRIINSNDKAQLSKFALTLNKDTYYINSLKSIFDVCNIDDINWTQKEGLNKVSIDNGDAISIYYIKFTNTQVILSEGRIQHSEIFGDYGDGYSSYESEDEYVTWYFFSITEQGLKFQKIDGAG